MKGLLLIKYLTATNNSMNSRNFKLDLHYICIEFVLMISFTLSVYNLIVYSLVTFESSGTVKSEHGSRI